VYVITYGGAYFLNDFSFKEHIFSKKEIQESVARGTSIIRFGDGEINLMLDLKNHYEKFSPALKASMQNIVRAYTHNSPYLLALPRFINMSNTELKSIGKFNVWLPLKVMFLLAFPKHVGYMDAHSFYYDGYFEEVIAPVIADKVIIYITRPETIEKQTRNSRIPWKRVVAVETPEHDAFGIVDEIKKKIDNELSKWKKEDVVLLVAMGPTGKHLIFEYARQGIQGIDVGVGLETMYTDISLESRI
jgi:hypothetical protein